MLQYGFLVGFESVKVVGKNARDQCIREVVYSVGGGESKEMGAQAGVGVESRGVGSEGWHLAV